MTVGVIQKLRDGLAWGQEAQRIINYGLALIRDASATVQGLIEIATDAEAKAKTATDKALVPSNLAALDASDTFAGLIEIATDAELLATTATDKATVPSNFAGLAAVETYTEGTFTPALAFGGASTGITYSAQSGFYTRVGRIVHIDIALILTSKGSATGNATITGLPLTVATTTPLALSVTVVTSGVGDTYLQAVALGGGTTMVLQDIAAGVAGSLTDVDFTDSTFVRIGGVYRTSA